MSSSNIEQLARAEIVAMTPYQSARRLEKSGQHFNQKIWLNANEAPGPGIYQITGECINRYPDFQPDNLLNAYSQYCQLPTDQLLATRGADEGIELIIRTFCRAYQDNILICPPTYGMYAISAENHGAGVVSVPLVNQQLDVDTIIAQLPQVKVVFLCSPGNPTGNLLARTDIEAILAASQQRQIIVVDEAYIEFCADHSVQDLLAQFPNLIILRTLSKAFALAGLRCGFTLASSEIIALLSKVIAPYPIAVPIAQYASESLQPEGISQMNIRVQETKLLRNELIQWLKAQPNCEQVFDSDTNFILFKTKQAAALFDKLKQAGMLIRDQSKQLQLANCLRITVGNEREISLFKQLSQPILSQANEEKMN
jgi:histidinol-phosphate aminotransferase